jgi:hypothetical protein
MAHQPHWRDRLDVALARDGGACVWCARPLHAASPDLTREHLVPRIKGGPSWAENELAACRSCNRRRGHVAPVPWLEDCEARGLRPDRPAVEGALLRLTAAIEERGGARRVRPYLASQLRRLGHGDRIPRRWR